MKKIIIALIVSAIVPILIISNIHAADGNLPIKKEVQARAIPFHGTIDSIDKQANTLKVGQRVFQITANTRIMKHNKPASLNDAKAGEEVGGAYRENADKKLNLITLRIGPKPEAAPTKEVQK